MDAAPDMATLRGGGPPVRIKCLLCGAVVEPVRWTDPQTGIVMMVDRHECGGRVYPGRVRRRRTDDVAAGQR